MRFSLNVSNDRFIAALAAIFALRLIAGAMLPLSADEAYYWLWSRHLAAGYYDHPPLIAFLVRGGVFLFGDTPFGVRIGAILMSFAASWFVWRAALILIGERGAARTACLLFNLTLMIGVETLAATPDAPSVLAAAAFFWALAEFAVTKDGRWWLVAGAAAGFGLMAKYTALFLGAGAVAWLALSTPYRKYFLSPWPYLGAAIGLLMFLPNVLWNADHGWATFAFQFGRAGGGGYGLKYLPDLIGGQLVLAGIFVLVSGGFGFAAASGRRDDARFLIAAMIWPALIYFLEHALHARVQGNWPCFVYPMLAVAAADPGLRDRLTGWWRKAADVSAKAAMPVAAVLLIAAYAQALFTVVPLGRKDPLARLLAVGMEDVTGKIEDLRLQTGARAILTTDYATTAWLSFYAAGPAPVAQLGEEHRYLDAPPLPAALAKGPLLYVCEARANRKLDQSDLIATRYAKVEEIARIERMRKGVSITPYVVYLASEPKDDHPLGKMP